MRPLLPGDGLPPPAALLGESVSVDSDMVVLVASLLCALISVIGLALVTRCACRRHPPPALTSSSNLARGLKKKSIEALPTVSFVEGRRGGSLECAICLAEFVEGEELRVLPHCSHAFHVACIDAWLGAHASCPSCRAAIMVPAAGRRCRRCGAACDQLEVEHATTVHF